MADDKRGREKQARDEDRRQRERDIAVELERWDETEPPVEKADLGDLTRDLDALDLPATGSDVIAAIGDREIESRGETYAVADLIPDTDAERFDSPAAVRVRLQRPTVAAGMKRIAEAAAGLQDAALDRSQREAYERTLRELERIEEGDENEGVRVVTDWIVERIRDKRALPGSRKVRQRAAKFCRANGYEVRDDEWLGA